MVSTCFHTSLAVAAECLANTSPVVIPASLTAVIAFSGLLVAGLTLRANYVLSRSKNSLDFEKNLEECLDYTESSDALFSFKKQSQSDIQALKSLARDDSIDQDAYDSAIYILNWWERGANGIRCGVYRDDVLYKVYCSHLINLGDYLSPFVTERRNATENKYIFRQFKWLYRKWKNKRNRENIPFYTKVVVFILSASVSVSAAMAYEYLI